MGRAVRQVAWCGIALVGVTLSATAQYGFDPTSIADDGLAIRYFGAAKDTGGSALSDVLVEITGLDAGFVFLTSGEGRFRGNLPLDKTHDKMKAKCSKKGFELVNLTMRPGPDAKLPTVQVDCVLRQAKSD